MHIPNLRVNVLAFQQQSIANICGASNESAADDLEQIGLASLAVKL